MRRLRRLGPGRLWEVTVRCHHSRFRLLPTIKRREKVGFWLAKAAAGSPGIEIFAVVVMSNHLHIVLRDGASELSSFMQTFLGGLAREINALDGRWGSVFERRFAAIEILDDTKLAERVAYTVCNPVEAGLVSRWKSWPGLLEWKPGLKSFSRFRSRAFERRRAVDSEADPEDFTERVELRIVGLAEAEPAVEERERRLRAGMSGCMGVRKVLAQDPMGRPVKSKRSPMPLCHAGDRDARAEYRLGWMEFTASFREASARFRAGVLEAVFPRWSFRPALPLLR